MKKIKVFLAVFVLILGTGNVYASASDTSNNTSDEILFYINDDGEAEYITEMKTINTPARGLYLFFGSGKIQMASPGQVIISGRTEANFSITRVMLSLTLERYDNGNWVSVTNKYFEATNTDYVTGLAYCSVTKNEIYRVSGTSSVYHNGLTESQTASTNGILAY